MVSIIQIEMVPMFKSTIELILIHLNGKLIVAIHLTVSIRVALYYFMFAMLVGPLEHIIMFYFQVEQRRVMCFVHLNQHQSQVNHNIFLIGHDVFIGEIDPDFWNFNIWDPGLSSTTSTTTTPPTTGTVTTRVNYISYNMMYLIFVN